MKMNYAIKDEKLIHISEVERGLKCNCICPCCNARLIARKGKIKEHHFAHANNEDCKKGTETMLHIMAKSILEKEKKIKIPKVHVLTRFIKSEYQYTYIRSIITEPVEELLSDEMYITFDKVELEKRIDDFIPDVILYNGDQCLLVEIKISHGIDEIKLEKIEKSNISTLEIDLSKFKRIITEEELKNLLINDVSSKNWIHNKKAKYYRDTWLSLCDQLKAVTRKNTKSKRYKYAYQVDGCSQNKRFYKGKPYANIEVDCYDCEYCIEIEREPFSYSEPESIVSIYCCGRNKISSIEELIVFLKNYKK